MSTVESVYEGSDYDGFTAVVLDDCDSNGEKLKSSQFADVVNNRSKAIGFVSLDHDQLNSDSDDVEDEFLAVSNRNFNGEHFVSDSSNEHS